MPAFLVPILISLIESTPALIAALGKEWQLLKGAAAENRDLTPAEMIALSANPLLASAALRAMVAQRTQDGNWTH